jgi:hypothetical protein
VSDWPEHSSELTRKTTEAVLKYADLHNSGKLSEKSFWLVLDALTDVTHGLIPSEDWQPIYDLRQDLRKRIRQKS